MRKALYDIQETEHYLMDRMDDPDKLLFEAKMIIDPALKINAVYQQKTYAVIRWFARRQQRIRLESLYNRVMRDKEFATEINTIFT